MSLISEWLQPPAAEHHDTLGELSTFGILHFADGTSEIGEQTILQRDSPQDLQEWLTGFEQSLNPNYKEIVGGLRLIYQQYKARKKPEGGIDRVLRGRVPFSAKELEVICKEMGLPQCLISGHKRVFVLHPNLDTFLTEQGEVHCIYGKFDCKEKSNNHQYYVSYRANTRILTACVVDIIEPEQKPQLIAELEKNARYASHPILIPLYFAGQRAHKAGEHCEKRRIDLYKVQTKVKLLDPFVRDHAQYMMIDPEDINDKTNPNRTQTLEVVHREIMNIHTHITVEYEDDAERTVNKILDLCTRPEVANVVQIGNCCHEHATLTLCVKHLVEYANRSVLRRNRILSGLDMQHKALYHELQRFDNQLSRNIAETSKRDSATMKMFTALGFVLLPPTAVASVFSMAPFFSSPGSLHVSSQFWIYWVVVICVTGSIIALGLIYQRLSTERGPDTTSQRIPADDGSIDIELAHTPTPWHED